ncbi:MAG: aminotransferase class V-fold PLP-dependent enzyme, partial [Candidatus Eremiobacteraeota bacterium]|nr:aminotransferase class V-fold PLP-dependent enzyme [Candidatus Eremiobacteraeota bacterium]
MTTLEQLRQSEFSRLDRARHVYLDYTGSGLYAESQIRRHSQWLLENVLGNPHSENPTSSLSTEAVEACRRKILAFFKADPREYEVVFTANASQALKLVGESYPFRPGATFLLTFDNHNSVNGIREYDRARGATTRYLPLTLPELRVDEALLEDYLEERDSNLDNLFAYPAQSNFSGVRHPLTWIEKAQQHGWDVLLDAAAFVPTAALDLSRWHPDYVALSFYKMFGYPTGVGALVARKAALAKLHRPWFAGGTIRMASVQSDRYLPAAVPAAFEDGTLDFSNIPAVTLGLELLEKVSYQQLGGHIHQLTGWLLDHLTQLQHPNGNPVVRIYGPTTTEARGGTIALNFLAPDGTQ